MGAKHSVPVTSTQNEAPSMPYLSSAQASEQHHHSSSYGKLSLNTATIRPHESAANSSHSQRQSAHSVTSAAAEAARMTPLDIKCDSFMLLPMLGTISSSLLLTYERLSVAL